MKNVKFSFIIPVYNVEKYLETCVESVWKQAYNNYEIILVDDGSTDSSGEICDALAVKDSRIVVIHKPNGGSSDARNVGLSAVTGDYILFIDSDDYIAPNALDAILHCLTLQKQPVDVMFLEAEKVFPDGTTIPLGDGYNKSQIDNQSKRAVMAHLASLPKYPGSACTKLIRTAVVREHNLCFECGITGEDLDFVAGLLLVAQTFAYCDADYYYYRQQRVGSHTYKTSLKSVTSLLYVIQKRSCRECVSECQAEINAFMAYEYMIVLKAYAKLSKQDKKIAYRSVKELAWVLKFAQTKRTKLTRACCACLGVRITSKLLDIAYKMQA